MLNVVAVGGGVDDLLYAAGSLNDSSVFTDRKLLAGEDSELMVVPPVLIFRVPIC